MNPITRLPEPVRMTAADIIDPTERAIKAEAKRRVSAFVKKLNQIGNPKRIKEDDHE